MSADMSPEAIDSRLREASRLSCLQSERRLEAKIDMTPRGIAARLRSVSELRRLCLRLVQLGEAHGLGRARSR